MRKMLVADGIEESRAALEALFRDRCDIRVCGDGESAIALLRDFEPDILVVDLMLPKTDGLSLLQQLRQLDIRPMILAQTNLASPYVMERLQQLGVDYVVQKPCHIQALEGRICDFLALLQDEPPRQPSGDQMLTAILTDLGLSAKLDGFRYLTDGIPLYMHDPSQSITKELYAAIGKMHHRQAALVERSIRSAIDKAWRERDEQVWRRYFRCGPNGMIPRPSNGAFIAIIAQFLAGKLGRVAL